MTASNAQTRIRRVAIVGGGLSGLATASFLHHADPSIEITLLEAGDRVGGVIHTERSDGFLIDHGADMFATDPPGVIPLCQRIGVADQLIEAQQAGRGARIVHRGRLVPVPEGFVVMRATKTWPMLTTPLLSPWGKLRFLAERWIPPLPPDTDESIGAFVRRRMGRQVLDRLVAPLAAGIYTGDVDQLSMLATMRPVAALEQRHGSLAAATAALRREQPASERQSAGARYERFRALAGGTRELIDGLARSFPAQAIRLGCPVERIETAVDGFRLLLASPAVSHSDLTFDHVVVAAPTSVAAQLIKPIAPAAAAPLSEIESASTAIVVVAARRDEIRRDINTFGFVVPPQENRQILAGSFASNKFAGRAPGDQVLIRVFIGGVLQPELLERSDDELASIARRELAELIGWTGRPTLQRVVRWNHAMPQYKVGHLQRADAIQQAIEQVPGLTLVGNAIGGVGIAYVVQSAARAAQAVVASFTERGLALGSAGNSTDTGGTRDRTTPQTD